VKPYAFHPQAAEEYAQAAQYYAAIAPELGGVSTTKLNGSSPKCAVSPRPLLAVQSSGPARIGP